MSEPEQNKRINQLRRQLAHAVERIKTLELDIEPEGRVSEAFGVLEQQIDESFTRVKRRFDRVDSHLDRMEHQFNRLQAKLEVISDTITGIANLPEDES
jgi:chaperonin cofactor prefoldin